MITKVQIKAAPAARSEERHRVSLFRMLLLIAVLGGLGFLGTRWAMAYVDKDSDDLSDTWLAPYIDVTLTPMLHFEEPSEQPSPDVVLGFIVADPQDECAPSWGTYYNLDAAARALDLDRRIVRLQEGGGSAMVSFGGALNNELATVCTDPAKLAAAYQSVIHRYGVTSLDFDIEGAAIGDREANQRRAAAIKKLQEKNPELTVWFTLPVAPHGLLDDAVALLDDTVAGGVDLGGVNVMLMNYGGSRTPDMTMTDANTAALLATWQQLDGVYQRAGTPLTEEELWQRIGATPMIGQNDTPNEVFTLADAAALSEYAATVDLGRISFWSANRDFECGANTDDGRVSNTCSGVDQEALEFSNTFASDSPGRRNTATPTPEHDDAEETAVAGIQPNYDPRTSPYGLWRSPKVYEEGMKVVWNGRVYQAKWWTQGDQPDAPVKNVWDTPWRYLGPVLESDVEAVQSQEPVEEGTWPRWAAEKVYVEGNEVEHDSKIYRAKWWTQGDLPQEDPDQPYDHPWEYLGKVKPLPDDDEILTPDGATATGTPTATSTATPTVAATGTATPSPTATPGTPTPTPQ